MAQSQQISVTNRYVIQDKHFSSDDKYVITDEAGNIHYKVDSTLFILGDKLILSDAAGTEIIQIRQENLHFHQTYNIFSIRRDEQETRLASIKRTGLPGQHKLEISAVNGNYIMEKRGSIFSQEFTLKKDDNIIAIVTKDTAPSKNTFWVDISNSAEELHAFILALVIVLSCAQRLPGNPLSTPHQGNVKA
ncbi:hypothetical protein I4U23_023898 [Adineta vaga]|nr:hypothetical protein I4U23_023898 [Adineta vaga]